MTHFSFKKPTIIKTLLLASTMLLGSFSTAEAREVVIGLSSRQSPQELKAQVQRIVNHVVQTVKPGEQALFFDATNAQLIASFIVPDKETYANPKAKIQANKKALAALKRFIDGAEADPGHMGRIDMPAFLRLIRSNYGRDIEGDAEASAVSGADMIVIGSPIAHDPRSPSTSMGGARVPNDGHVAASVGVSPYGTTGLSGSLKGYNVYWGLVGDEWSISTPHAYHTERFWTLSVESHGGSIQFFGDDLQTLLISAGKEKTERRHTEPLQSTDKLEMLHFAADTGEVPDLYAQPLEEEPAPEPIWRSASNVRIGITWDCLGCDLDLYVRPKLSSPVIFYAQATTNEGRLFKDFTNSPTTGFETVALNGTIDLSTTQIAVNFYDGQAENSVVTGELRIAIGDEVWAAPFKFNANIGNLSAGAEEALTNNEAPNAHWTIVSPLDVLGSQ